MESILFSCIESRIQNKRHHFARFQLGPFFRIQAITLANTLRRILLSDLTSLNVIAVNIIGVTHEYSSLIGIRESVLDILLNIKQLIFIEDTNIDNNLSYFAYLRCNGPKIVKANDLILPNCIKCVDLDQYIATLSYDGKLVMKLKLNYGYTKDFIFKKNNLFFNPLLSYYFNYIFKNTKFPITIDSNFSSVNKVNYIIDFSNNLEEYNNFIILDVWTNGSLSPRFALESSIKISINLFLSMYNISSSEVLLQGSNNFLKTYLLTVSNKSFFLKNNFSQLSNNIKNYNNIFDFTNNFRIKSINELKISLQLKFLLKEYGIETIEDLLNINKKTLSSYFNCSNKCIDDISSSLNLYNLYLRD